jgi:acyl-CoA reductase-like NAD-dependent aldehyde dehydrogenase
MTYIPSLNPSQNYEVIGSVESTSTSELPKIVANARIGQTLWNKISPSERVRMLERAYMGFLVKKERISQNIAKEIGMQI